MSGTWQITPFFVGGRSSLVYLQQSGDHVAGLWDIEYPYPVDAQLPPFCAGRSGSRVDLAVAVAISFAGSFTDASNVVGTVTAGGAAFPARMFKLADTVTTKGGPFPTC